MGCGTSRISTSQMLESPTYNSYAPSFTQRIASMTGKPKSPKANTPNFTEPAPPRLRKWLLMHGPGGLFEHIGYTEYEAIRAVAHLIDVNPNESFNLKKDDTVFYVIGSGHLLITVQPEDPDGAPQVLEIDQQDLEVDLPRTSSEFLSVSVNALTAGKLWMAGQAQLQTVRAQLKKKETEEYLRLLNQIPMLTDLSPKQREKIVGIMETDMYMHGEFIVRQGERGDTLFFVLEGGAVATQSFLNRDGVPEGTPREITRYGPGGYFGEMALLLDCPRKANVMATQFCKVACVNKRSFKKLVSPLHTLLHGVMVDEEEEDSSEEGMLTRQDSSAWPLDRVSAKSMSGPEHNEMSLMDVQLKQVAMKGERRSAICAEDMHFVVQENKSPARNFEHKNKDAKKRIVATLKSKLTFQSLEPEKLEEVVEAMFPVLVKAGDVVIAQGDHGDHLYVVDSGEFEVMMSVEGRPAHKVTEVQHGGSFGELALMYDSPRAATVLAKSAGRLWALDRSTFRALVVNHIKKVRQQLEHFLNGVPLLKKMSENDRSVLADAIEMRQYKDGEYVVRQGEVGDKFCILMEGRASATQILESESEAEVLMEYTEGAYFGEIALCRNELRRANVVAQGRIKVAELSAQAFRRLMGSISDALEDNINQYKESPKAGSQPGTPTFNRAVSTGPSVLSRTLSSAARVPLATAHWKRRMSARRRAIYCRGSLPRASLDLLRTHEKSDDAKQRILATVKNNVALSQLPKSQLEQILDAMQEKEVRAGDFVIRQGEIGDYFYVVDSGEFEVFINGSPSDGDVDDPDNPALHKVKHVAHGGSFGELALLHDMPRAASVRAKTHGKLWALCGNTFRSIVIEANTQHRERMEHILETTEVLAILKPNERALLADSLQTVHYDDGDYIVLQGDKANRFYILLEGQAQATFVKPGASEPTILMEYAPGTYFGELALLYNETRKCNVVAQGACTTAALDKSAFNRLLGPLSKYLERQMSRYSSRSLLSCPSDGNMDDTT